MVDINRFVKYSSISLSNLPNFIIPRSQDPPRSTIVQQTSPESQPLRSTIVHRFDSDQICSDLTVVMETLIRFRELLFRLPTVMETPIRFR
ncbi:hypothetical protein HanRHA438_Chr15g0723521 [Helianthus annuus]|nr:hypothetical protein HanRHA438_Chr15g0723521 [Helianthus annuus]